VRAWQWLLSAFEKVSVFLKAPQVRGTPSFSVPGCAAGGGGLAGAPTPAVWGILAAISFAVFASMQKLPACRASPRAALKLKGRCIIAKEWLNNGWLDKPKHYLTR
jgi:hypothetical protein